eukprot:15433537-Alexandrium_andersonii.AAC.1
MATRGIVGRLGDPSRRAGSGGAHGLSPCVGRPAAGCRRLGCLPGSAAAGTEQLAGHCRVHH